MKYVDISNNKLSGQVDALFAPAFDYLNASGNVFTSVDSFKKYKLSHSTLRICDLSNNRLLQNVTDFVTDMPPNIEILDLTKIQDIPKSPNTGLG